MSYTVQPPVVAPPATAVEPGPRRPVAVTLAAVVLALMAVVGLAYAIAAIATAPGTVDRFRSAAAGAAGTDVDGYVDVIWIGAAIGTVLAVILVALYFVLALGLRRGSNPARIATWVVCGLGLLAGCGSTVTVLVQRSGPGDPQSLGAALSGSYPHSWIGLNLSLAIAQMIGYVVVALLLLAGRGAWFGRGPVAPGTEVGSHQGYGTPGYGTPGSSAGYDPSAAGVPGYGVAAAPGYGVQSGYITQIPGTSGYSGQAPGTSGYAAQAPGAPGYPAQTPGTSGSAAQAPGTPGYGAQAPGMPGYPGQAPGASGYGAQAPGTPGYAAQAPGTPGYPAQAPGAPGYPAQTPGMPGYPAQAPGAPGYGGQAVGTPGYGASGGGLPGSGYSYSAPYGQAQPSGPAQGYSSDADRAYQPGGGQEWAAPAARGNGSEPASSSADSQQPDQPSGMSPAPQRQTVGEPPANPSETPEQGPDDEYWSRPSS